MAGIGFCGCSLTEGAPFIEVNESYANIVNNYFQPDLFLNYATSGSGNKTIFLQAMRMVLTDVNHIFVQWSFPGRQKWYYGFDKWVATNNSEYNNPLKNKLSDHNFKNFVDAFKIIDSTYNQYYELKDQITILNTICKKLNKNIYYINGGMHIDPVLLNKTIIYDAYLQLLPESRNILDLDNLPDADIRKSIKEVREMLTIIDKTQWVNIERIARVDRGYDGSHPGPKSNIINANNIIKFLEDKIQ